MTPSRIQVDAHPTRCPDAASAVRIEQLILEAKSAGDSLGGIVEARVEGLPIGLGEPVFGKLKARLADAVAGIGAVSGVVWGGREFLADLQRRGSEFHGGERDVYGGIQAG